MNSNSYTNQYRENIARINHYETKPKELCARIAPDMDNCTNGERKDAYRYLDLKITATPEDADIKGYLDPRVLTTEQTSASRYVYSYQILAVLLHRDLMSRLFQEQLALP